MSTPTPTDLQNFQDKFVRKLLRLPPSTPKAILHWDSGIKRMKRRITEKKLLFFGKIMLKEESNIMRKALMNETFMGLSHECRQLTEIMGVPDIMTNLVSIGEIKQAVARHSNQEIQDEI